MRRCDQSSQEWGWQDWFAGRGLTADRAVAMNEKAPLTKERLLGLRFGRRPRNRLFDDDMPHAVQWEHQS
jgi:hypothetical protein